MQTPKLLWIKEHLPHSWKRAARFFDLADFMVYRATGYDVRSLCTTVCKWTYLGHEPPLQPGTIGRWEPGYFELIGLKDLVDEGFQRIGRKIRPIGEPAGEGLTAEAAKEMGLETGTAVSIAIIDAHAGGIGLLGATVEGRKISELELERRLAIIAGTSSCHMAVSGQPHFVPGVWGPYKSAMIPGMWLTEGGQTSTGSLVNHVIFSHAHSHDLKEEAKYYGQTIYERLNFRVEQMAKNEAFRAALTQNIHVLPYFHGNRSPLADATLRGMISGLNLSYSEEDLARLYLATIQAIAYGDRHIIAEMNAHGYEIDTVFICAGLTKNKLFLKESADITQCKMILPLEPEAVLLGSSILGAVASKDFSSILEAMQSMCHAGTIVLPEGGDVAAYHDAKYAVFHEMYRNQVQYNAMMRPPF